LVVVSVLISDRIIVESLAVPVVVCGVSQAAIVKAKIATNKMPFIKCCFKLKKLIKILNYLSNNYATP